MKRLLASALAVCALALTGCGVTERLGEDCQGERLCSTLFGGERAHDAEVEAQRLAARVKQLEELTRFLWRALIELYASKQVDVLAVEKLEVALDLACAELYSLGVDVNEEQEVECE